MSVLRRIVRAVVPRRVRATFRAPAPPAKPAPPERPPRRRPPERFRVRPAPPEIGDDWPDAPAVDEPGRVLRSAGRRIAPAPRMDVELFEALNREYELKPLSPNPPRYDSASTAKRARSRLLNVHRAIGLAGMRVLEIGCGQGYEVWYLAHHFGSEAWGVDVVERRAWAELTGPSVHLECADLAQKNPFPEDFFDCMISFAVWEHVRHPRTVLAEAHRSLKPGGLFWLRANLYRGPKASHRYRDVFFPWPHLLFSEDAWREFYRRRGEPKKSVVWVNKMTWEQYEDEIEKAGFLIRMLRFDTTPVDEELYRRFEHILGAYPRRDLERDFFTAVLEKPA